MYISISVCSFLMSSETWKLFKVLPFYNITNYEIETLFESAAKRIKRLMNDHRLTEYIKNQRLSKILGIEQYSECNYYDIVHFNNI